MREEEFETVARQIWGEIEKAKRVLLCLHRRPDGDSVGVNLALKWVLEEMGKEVEVVGEWEMLEFLEFLRVGGEVRKQDIRKMDFARWDLWLVCDCGSWFMVSGDNEWQPSLPRKVRLVNIDHHITNEIEGDVNLVMPEVNSTCEVVYRMLRKWRVKVDRRVAEVLLLGILEDSGVFQYAGTTAATLRAAADLMQKGANLGKLVFFKTRRNSLAMYRYWGMLLGKVEVDVEGKFVYTALSFEEREVAERWGSISSARERAAGMFFHHLEGTEFGLVLEETVPGVVEGSLRSRTDFDVSKVAVALGGGGHKAAAGFQRRFEGSFEDEMRRILAIVREVAKKEYGQR